FLQRRAVTGTGYTAHGPALLHHLTAFQLLCPRRRTFGDVEANQPGAWPHFLEAQQRIAAVELRLAEAHHSLQPRTKRIRQSVRVLADDQVSFLQPQDALCLDAERLQPKG